LAVLDSCCEVVAVSGASVIKASVLAAASGVSAIGDPVHGSDSTLMESIGVALDVVVISSTYVRIGFPLVPTGDCWDMEVTRRGLLDGSIYAFALEVVSTCLGSLWLGKTVVA